MQNNRAIDISVGLFILLGLAAMLLLAAQTIGRGQLGSGETYRVAARFDHIGDLKVRAAVSLAGVTIGRVESIVADPVDFQAVVTLQIDATFDKLPADTGAIIESSGLLGGKHVALEPGGDTEVLHDSDEIFLTQSSISLENLIGKYMLKGDTS
jgi:phospholipid/cholesterol/gamma-HCH transport system substrate-binding protein